MGTHRNEIRSISFFLLTLYYPYYNAWNSPWEPSWAYFNIKYVPRRYLIQGRLAENTEILHEYKTTFTLLRREIMLVKFTCVTVL